jgi:hypothetical protein
MIGRRDHDGIDAGAGERLFDGERLKGRLSRRQLFAGLAAMLVVDVANAAKLRASGRQDAAHHLVAAHSAADERHAQPAVGPGGPRPGSGRQRRCGRGQ